MNIIKSLTLSLLFCGALSSPVLTHANTNLNCCPESPFTSADAASIDHMEDIIREGINESVKIVKPVYDSRVRSYLRTYIESQPSYTEEMMGRAEIYFPLFEKYLEAYGLPTDLKYLAIVESSLRPAATSYVGAAGMWQFMRPTGRMLGLKITQYVDERRDPEKSTEAAVIYLKQLYDRFGSWELAMAAYNAGPGRVNSAIRRSGSDDYWKIQNYLPRETRSYVPGFIAVNYLFNHYSNHDLTPTKPHSDFDNTAVIKILEGISFQDINSATGVALSSIKRLNPKYTRSYVPQSVMGYDVTLPAFAIPAFIEYLGISEEDAIKYTNQVIPMYTGAVLKYEKRSAMHPYRVKSGDNLYRIAQANGCSVNNLMSWNNLSSSKLRINQRLKIQITERVAIYPDVTLRQVDPIVCVPSLLSIDNELPIINGALCTHSSPNLFQKVNSTIPDDAIIIRRRMSVVDAIRLRTDEPIIDVSKAQYKSALPGYRVVHDNSLTLGE